MQVHHINSEKRLLVLEKGDLVIAELTRYCQDAGIVNAALSGIGAVDHIQCGYYDLVNRSYRFSEYTALYEVVSLTANVILKEGKPFVHMHAVFTDQENHAFGGHVEEMRVGVTLEIVCDILPARFVRQYDEATGLFLIASEDAANRTDSL